jgi:hypothetical protein
MPLRRLTTTSKLALEPSGQRGAGEPLVANFPYALLHARSIGASKPGFDADAR